MKKLNKIFADFPEIKDEVDAYWLNTIQDNQNKIIDVLPEGRPMLGLFDLAPETNATNFNELWRKGVFRFPNSNNANAVANSPQVGAGYLEVETLRDYRGNTENDFFLCIVQKYTNLNGDIYQRNRDSGADGKGEWTPWRRIDGGIDCLIENSWGFEKHENGKLIVWANVSSRTNGAGEIFAKFSEVSNKVRFMGPPHVLVEPKWNTEWGYNVVSYDEKKDGFTVKCFKWQDNQPVPIRNQNMTVSYTATGKWK